MIDIIMLWQGLRGHNSTVHALPWHKPVAATMNSPFKGLSHCSRGAHVVLIAPA